MRARGSAGPAFRRLLVLGGAAWALCACSARPTESTIARPSSQKAAIWLFHPTSSSPVTDVSEQEGERLEVDRDGSRWLVERAGQPVASAFGAPEPLTGVLRHDDRILVLGRSGAVRVAREPLGPFEETRLPPIEFVDTRRTGSVFVGVGRDGSVHRSEDGGQAWSRVRLPMFVVELARSGEQEILAQATPESWFLSGDRGRTFTEIATPPLAPRELVERPGAKLRIAGLLGVFEWNGSRFAPVTPTPSGATPRTTSERTPPRHASPTPIGAGEATFTGFEYARLLRSQPTASWSVESGRIDTALERRHEPAFDGCAAMKLSRSGAFVHALCEPPHTGDATPLLALFRSRDGGRSFTKSLASLRGSLAGVALATDARGRLAVSGVCPEATQDIGCAPRGVQFLEPDAGATKPVPFLEVDAVQRLAFSAEGTLFTLARGRHEGRVVLHRVAGDLAASWERDVGREAGLGPNARVDFVDLFVDEPGARADDGVLVLLRVAGRRHLARFDARGELESSGEAPPGVEIVSGSSRRLGGLDARAGLFWETSNAGVSWSKAPLPRTLCAADERTCRKELVCREAGCLVGEELVRVGWGSEAKRRGDVAENAAVEARVERRGAPFVCERIGSSDENLSSLVAVPDVSEAALGDALFVQTEVQVSEATASVIHASFGAPRLDRHELLGKPSSPGRFAWTIVNQIEGVAALRYRQAVRQADPVFREVEVAWDNRVTNVLARARLPGEFVPQAGDFESTAAVHDRATPALLSVAGKGLYLRLHGARDAAQPTYFFEGSTAQAASPVRTLPARSWPNLPADFEDEMIRVGTTDVALGWTDRGRTVVRAVGDDFVALSLAPFDLGRRRISVFPRLVYVGAEPALASGLVDDEATFGSASVVPFTPDGFGKARPVPLLADLPVVPPPCLEETRRTTPRVVAPDSGGFRHVVFVRSAGGAELRLETGRAIVQGSLETPCVSVFEAGDAQPRTAAENRVRALFVPGGLGWIFREENPTSAARRVLAFPVRCRVEVEPEATQDHP